MEINGRSTKDMTHADAIELIKQCGSSVSLLVKRGGKLPQHLGEHRPVMFMPRLKKFMANISKFLKVQGLFEGRPRMVMHTMCLRIFYYIFRYDESEQPGIPSGPAASRNQHQINSNIAATLPRVHGAPLPTSNPLWASRSSLLLPWRVQCLAHLIQWVPSCVPP